MGVSVGVADVLEAIAGTKFALSVLWATVSGGNITHVWNIHACIKLEIIANYSFALSTAC